MMKITLAKLKKQRTDLSMLTKEERLARRRESLTAGDDWHDKHGTKDRPEKQTFHGKNVWTHAKDGKITVTPRNPPPRLSEKPSSGTARV